MATDKTQQPTAATLDFDTQGALQIELSESEAGQVQVAVVWAGNRDLPLNGWQLRDDQARNTYTFADVTLSPGASVRVHPGGDAAQDSASDLHWGEGKVRWDDDEVLHLLDPRGIVQAQCVFGAALAREAARGEPAAVAPQAAGKTTSASARKTAAAKKTAATKKTAAKKNTATIKKTAKANKAAQSTSQAIRAYFAGRPDATVDEAVEHLSKQGIKTSRGYVKNIRSSSNPAPKRKTAAGGGQGAEKKKAGEKTERSAVSAYDTRGALRVDGAGSKFDTPGRDCEHEVVKIVWDGPEPLSLRGWQLHDHGSRHRYRFGDVTLASGSAISLHTGGDPAYNSATDLYWGRSSAVWNNQGDEVRILDPNGNVQTRYAFVPGSPAASAGLALAAGGAAAGSNRPSTVVLAGKQYVVPPPDANQQAMRLIWRHVAIASAVGFVPIPLFDLAALTGVQLIMISLLGDLYHVRFTESAGRKAVISLISACLPVSSLRFTAFSLLRVIPLVGPSISALTVPIMAGATTYAVGKVFNLHFATGGTFLSFDPNRYKEQFEREFAQGMKLVRQENQQ